jgi:hypothetical protein
VLNVLRTAKACTIALNYHGGTLRLMR